MKTAAAWGVIGAVTAGLGLWLYGVRPVPAERYINQVMSVEACESFMVDYYRRYQTSKPSEGELEVWNECIMAHATSLKIASIEEWRRSPMSESECGHFVMRTERCWSTNGCFNSTRDILLQIQCASSYVSARNKQSQFIREHYPD